MLDLFIRGWLNIVFNLYYIFILFLNDLELKKYQNQIIKYNLYISFFQYMCYFNFNNYEEHIKIH